MNYEPWVEPAIEAAPASEMTGDEFCGDLPVGNSTVLPEPCQEIAQGSLEPGLAATEAQRHREGKRDRRDAFLSIFPTLHLFVFPSLCLRRLRGRITDCCLRREFRGTRPAPGSIRR